MAGGGATGSADGRARAQGPRTLVYTCTFQSYDNLLSPLRRTPGATFLHFSDRRAPLTPGWRFRPLPPEAADLPQNEANRYCKLLPHRVLPEADVSIYVDGNILVLDDLTPLIAEFLASDADIALFPGEDDRTVEEEIELVLQGDRLSPARAEAARAQLAAYRGQGLARLPITMNGVLFRRHGRPRLDALMEAWWQETEAWAMRDQFSLPPLLARSEVSVHRWDWQFFYVENPYFFVTLHRRDARRRLGALFDVQGASIVRARFSRRDRLIQRGLVEPLRRVLGRPPIPSDPLRPAPKAQPKGE